MYSVPAIIMSTKMTFQWASGFLTCSYADNNSNLLASWKNTFPVETHVVLRVLEVINYIFTESGHIKNICTHLNKNGTYM